MVIIKQPKGEPEYMNVKEDVKQIESESKKKKKKSKEREKNKSIKENKVRKAEKGKRSMKKIEIRKQIILCVLYVCMRK